jgi:hypothetical protein
VVPAIVEDRASGEVNLLVETLKADSSFDFREVRGNAYCAAAPAHYFWRAIGERGRA